MGIPKFFRWLTRRYPQILQNVTNYDELPQVDNFYMDLNGIVHNCIHGNDPSRHERISKLNDLEEVWAGVMQAIDELVHTIKPKKVLLLAVDGVAPRAKMNQQRARRFRSAKEAQDLKAKLNAQGKNVPDLFDSNAISPGTEFMMELCHQLHFFVKHKASTDPLYQGLEIVLTDGTVPGEGEHKMMDYIRQLRLKESYDPNTRHCFYGADADLIMLSLLTHEPHFTIIREEHVVRKQKNGGVQRLELSKTSNFQLIYVSLLREYMMLEYKPLAGNMKIKFDLERIIDDFVFFCFFIGNDFLPSLSALDIAEGSLDKLIDFYQKCLPQMNNYITDSGTIHWDRAEPFIWLLGEHEQEVFRNRIDQIQDRRRGTRTVHVTQDQVRELQGKGQYTQNAYKQKLFQKKQAKVEKLKIEGKTKHYKKYLYSKLFKEDNLPQARQAERDTLLAKLKLKMPGDYEPLELIKLLDDGFVSDLRPEEIPDDQVSEVETTMESLENGAGDQGVQDAIAELDQKAEDENLKFMTTFVKKYAEDAHLAKQFYYQSKVEIDIDTDTGKLLKNKMLKKYLEGTQWVLYYYYKGAPHWRWFYPYHYAPLISDLGINIVKDFLGNTTITNFEVDYNCPVNSLPYTPFQQLLCIMPLRSFKLLPPEFAAVPQTMLDQYPTDFGLDLNGKTNAWEAIVLIPFVDESQVLAAEKHLFDQGLVLSESDKIRNSISFEYMQYNYDPKLTPRPLKSTLTSLTDDLYDCTVGKVVREYDNVGTKAFEPRLLPGVRHPSPGYPSFKYLNVIALEPEHKVVQKVSFVQQLVVMPQCIEESQPDELEKFVKKLVNASNKEVFVGFPFQQEAFAMYFEDKFTIYTIYGDVASNQFQLHKDKQFRTPDEWQGHVNRTVINLSLDKGIFCPLSKVNVLVTCNRVESVQFDYKSGTYYKTYREQPDVLPLSLLMRKRDYDHPMKCLNVRTGQHPERELQPKTQVVCLNLDKFGLLGSIHTVDQRKQTITVTFDKAAEESKVHDPFMGRKLLKSLAQNTNVIKEAQFFGDQDIEQQMGLKAGIISRITSSFLISYCCPETREKMVVDLGLNIKNFTKRVHVPTFVRFVQNAESAMNEHDSFQHNKFARGANHVRSHWEYSFECVEFIKQYFAQFPQVFEAVKKCGSKGPAVNKLKDLYGTEDASAVAKVKEIISWIESLPISQLPYVEMGFDALDPKLIETINQTRKSIKTDFAKVALKVQLLESFKPHMIFAERFPYWIAPFGPRNAREFKTGDRVMNLNSMLRQYVPFGLRGTVIGRTEDKVMVLFDDQFIGGGTLFNQCENYRGAMLNPNYLLNLTKKFESAQQKQASNSEQVLNMFTERPMGQQEETKRAPQQTPQELNQPKEQKEPKAVKETKVYRAKGAKEAPEVGQVPQVVFQPIPATLSNDFKGLLKEMGMNPDAPAFTKE